MGNPSTNSNTWRVFHSGNRSARRQPFVHDAGRSWRDFLGDALLLPFYFVTLFISFFPWSIKLPWLIRKLWRNREAVVDAPGYSRSPVDTYLLWGIAVIFVIFTLVSTKLPHYTLPGFPLLALLLARHWHQGAAVPKPSAATSSRALPVRDHRGRNCVYVDRNCPRGSANSGAVFPCVSALPSVARVFTAEHAICCGRVPRAKSGVVFSLPSPRFSHATEQASRC